MNLQMMAELFGGASRYQALRVLFENPKKGYGARELGAIAGIDPGAASRWLRRWADIGLLDKVAESKTACYRISSDPALCSLIDFFKQDSTVLRVLRERLAETEISSQAAAIFGSVARGTEHAESDIDLLVITEGSRLELQAHFKPAGRTLNRKVNVLTFTPDEWSRGAQDNLLIKEILSNPLIAIKGTVHVEKT